MKFENDLFSIPESPERTTRRGKLADNQIQITRNTKSGNYYVRFNLSIVALIERKNLQTVSPVYNNLTGEVYLVFSDKTGKYPTSTNGGNTRSYVFSRPCVETLIEQAARRKIEDLNEIWTVSGDVSVSAEYVVIRIEKCFA